MALHEFVQHEKWSHSDYPHIIQHIAALLPVRVALQEEIRSASPQTQKNAMEPILDVFRVQEQWEIITKAMMDDIMVKIDGEIRKKGQSCSIKVLLCGEWSSFQPLTRRFCNKLRFYGHSSSKFSIEVDQVNPQTKLSQQALKR